MERKLWERTGPIIEAAMRVHSVLGPGLLESTYETCLAHELRKRGLAVRVQVPVPLVYDGIELEVAYRLDLLVDDEIIVEVKGVTQLHPVHEAQLLTYLRLSHRRVGLLLNFHSLHLRNGIKRMVNGWEHGARPLTIGVSSTDATSAIRR